MSETRTICTVPRRGGFMGETHKVDLMLGDGRGGWECIGVASRDDTDAPRFDFDANHLAGGEWSGVWEWVEECLWEHRVRECRDAIVAMGPLVTPAHAYDLLYKGAADAEGRLLLDAARAMLEDEGFW